MSFSVDLESGIGRLRTAVILRGHAPSAKFTEMAAALTGSDRFDLYVATNDSRGPVDVGSFPRLPYTLESLSDLGFEFTDEYALIHCSDLLFASFLQRKPEYDRFIMVEYDVQILGQPRETMESLLDRLDARPTVDLFGTWLSPRGQAWPHYATTASQFPGQEVMAAFFPFVMLSRRAIEHLLQLRHGERPAGEATRDRAYCEAFAATALASNPAFRIADLRDIWPGSYDADGFYFGDPMLYGGPHRINEGVRFLHPVYPPEDFAGRLWHAAKGSNTLIQYRALLSAGSIPLPDDLRRQLIYDATSALNDPERVEGGQATSRRADAPPGVEVWIRPPHLPEADLDQRLWEQDIGGGPLVEHLASYFERAGARLVTREHPGFATAGQDGVAAAFPASGARRLLAEANQLSDIHLGALAAFHVAEGRPATAVVVRPSSMVLGLRGDVRRAFEALPFLDHSRVYAGLLLIDPGVFPDEEVAQPITPQRLLSLHGAGRLALFEHDGFWQDVRTEAELSMMREIWRIGDAPWGPPQPRP